MALHPRTDFKLPTNYVSLNIAPGQWHPAGLYPFPGAAPAGQSEITLVELLKLTRDLLESGWTQRAEAKDPAGNAVLPAVGVATAWCLRGALRAAATVLEPDPALVQELFIRGYHHLTQMIRLHAFDGAVEAWNDASGRTHAEILCLMDRAIQWLK